MPSPTTLSRDQLAIDLAEMVRRLVQALTPGRPDREEPRRHRSTLDGR